MEIFFLLILLVLVIILLAHSYRNNNAANQLQHDIMEMRKELQKLNKQLESQQVKPFQQTIVPEKKAEDKNIAREQEPYIPVKKEITEEKVQPAVTAEDEKKLPEIIHQPVVLNTPPQQQTPPEPQVSWFNKWLHDNPDIEKFIGENLINKIGIAVLVLGIAFFVKYAIDQEWINKVGRVCIGLLCGVLLIGFAHRLRKNYHSFSSVLVGGGLAVFYFTIAFAFHQYHLIEQTPAFVIMVVITIFAVILSVLYNRIELAVIAAIGGFITPFLVSNGEGNYIVLFSYLTILNTGLIVLAYYKRWRLLNFLAFIFTEIIYGGWIFQKTGTAGFPYKGTFIFGAVFYLLFVVMNVIHHVIRGSKLKAFDFMILLSVNLFFYASGIYLMQEWGVFAFKGLFTVSLGIINLALAYIFFKRSKADRNFIFLLIGITLIFISLTAPVQLKGHYITLFWSAEMVVLLWLYQKSFIKLFKVALLLVTALTLISLIWDWTEIYTTASPVFAVVFNKGFVTGFFAASCMLGCYTLMRKEADTYFLGGFTNDAVKLFYLLTAVILLFCVGAFEVYSQFNKRLPGTKLEYVYLQLYFFSFATIVFFALQKLKTSIGHAILIIPFLTFMIYVFNLINIYEAETGLLIAKKNEGYFAAQWISILLLIVLAWETIKYLRNNKTELQKIYKASSWLICLSLITLFSIEAMHLLTWFNFTNEDSIEKTETMYYKAGLTIVWALSSFVIMWLGMSNRYKPLRIIALVVFGVTLVKLFIFDIRNIAPAGKIIAFILLGVLLLIISFMYQRLKKIIIDDVEHKDE
jgi:uncharacterized membrane protein